MPVPGQPLSLWGGPEPARAQDGAVASPTRDVPAAERPAREAFGVSLGVDHLNVPGSAARRDYGAGVHAFSTFSLAARGPNWRGLLRAPLVHPPHGPTRPGVSNPDDSRLDTVSVLAGIGTHGVDDDVSGGLTLGLQFPSRWQKARGDAYGLHRAAIGFEVAAARGGVSLQAALSYAHPVPEKSTVEVDGQEFTLFANGFGHVVGRLGFADFIPFVRPAVSVGLYTFRPARMGTPMRDYRISHPDVAFADLTVESELLAQLFRLRAGMTWATGEPNVESLYVLAGSGTLAHARDAFHAGAGMDF